MDHPPAAPGGHGKLKCGAEGVDQGVRGRLAPGVRQVRRDQMELSPTGSHTERSWFLLSSGCDGSRYYQVAHGTGQIPNETQFRCWILVACLMMSPFLWITLGLLPVVTAN